MSRFRVLLLTGLLLPPLLLLFFVLTDKTSKFSIIKIDNSRSEELIVLILGFYFIFPVLVGFSGFVSLILYGIKKQEIFKLTLFDMLLSILNIFSPIWLMPLFIYVTLNFFESQGGFIL